MTCCDVNVHHLSLLACAHASLAGGQELGQAVLGGRVRACALCRIPYHINPTKKQAFSSDVRLHHKGFHVHRNSGKNETTNLLAETGCKNAIEKVW
jgi:hypothetical protein